MQIFLAVDIATNSLYWTT